MEAFLRQVALHLEQNYKEKLDELCVVLPNKRGALFLKHHLAKVYGKTIWLPAIISAEDFIAELAGTQNMEDVDLTCRLYESYCLVYGEKAEPFDSFAKWGNLILQDFNEIDRYLVDAKALYSNLKEIKEIENWSLSEEKLSEFQVNYLDFMRHLGEIYSHFTETLLANNESYQGLAYKQAVKNFGQSTYIARYKKIVFCGFNALNKAETIIFSKLCQSGKAEIIWDADKYYLEDNVQEAGIFLRRNLKLFPEKEPNFIGEYFKAEKDIQIISVPKQMGQAQTVRKLIDQLLDEGVKTDSIAVVLANEKLLWPVLKMLPDRVEHVNITMEYPMRYTSAYSCIDLLLKIHFAYQTQSAESGKKQKHIYYKDFLNLLRHPFFKDYLDTLSIPKNNSSIIQQVMEKNYAFINENLLKELYAGAYESLKLVFQPWNNTEEALKSIQAILSAVKQSHLNSELNNYKSLELEYLEVLIRNFNRIKEISEKYEHFKTLKSFKVLFNQVLGSASAAFIGEPLKGLQVMGVLETRTLDFEHIIFVSVNEGVLPSGKSQNSFIPNDLKRYFGLPLYGDKDAIYAYHFYRLLQRCKTCFITYDSETDTFGKGEKSRFVSQLESEMKVYNPEMKIHESVALSTSFMESIEHSLSIGKTELTLENIRKKALSNEEFHALSPSSLISFKDCSLKFYFRYGAGLKEPAALEESAEANTFGSILHESLEGLYKPFIGKNIRVEDIEQLKKSVPATVEKNFLNYFSKAEAFLGKNLLQQNVLQVYVDKLLEFDKVFLSSISGKDLFIVDLEKEMSASIQVKIDGKEETVYVKGKADRIDRVGEVLRIVDYKSSVQQSDKFEFSGFEMLFSSKNYDKMLQLFLYAWLAYKNKMAAAANIQPCIIPFKKFEKEPRHLILKDKTVFRLTDELLREFEEHLKVFVSTIFDRNKEFLQTDDQAVCEFCAYNVICHRME
jgi:ATP-dependent helicase/nuclease subunit B